MFPGEERESLLQSILQTSELLRQGSVSPVELASDCLARIEELNPKLNAFITVTAESALAAARQGLPLDEAAHWAPRPPVKPIRIADIVR